MPTAVAVLSATLCFLSTTASFAGENPLLGTWKLKNFVREVAATGERYNERGEHPTAIFPTERMAACMRLSLGKIA
jgi:hypothetical protein